MDRGSGVGFVLRVNGNRKEINLLEIRNSNKETISIKCKNFH